MNKFVCAALLFAVVALASLEAQEEIALKQQFALYTKKFNKVYVREMIWDVPTSF